MTAAWIVAAGSGVVAFLCLAYCVRLYIELFRWARQCQSAQIALSYKGKVKLTAPLVEWLLWCNQLKGDEANGRVVYHMGGTSVAIIKGRVKAKRNLIAAYLTGRKRPTRTGPASNPLREGRWAARDDKTGVRGGTK